MRNVKVPRVQAADKAAQERITAVCVILDIDQTDLMVDVETKGVSFFDAHNAAGFALHCLVEGADELLRLAGASCRNGLLYVPLILLLPGLLGLSGVAMSQPAADFLTFLVSIPFQIWFFRHKLRG